MSIPAFTSRTALVTGASRGIGKAIAIALADAGARVAINYRQRKEDAEEAVAAVRRTGRESAAFAADVTDAGAVAAMISNIEKTLGPLDILVNNAGVALRRSLDEITELEFDQTIATNLKSAFLCTQAVWPGMRARGWGRIVNISSGAARGAGGFGVHYNASKAGLEGLTRGYAARLVKYGITVNAVAPSLIDTEMIAAMRAESEGQDSGRATGHGRGNRRRGRDGSEQCLHDGADGRDERGSELQLTLRLYLLKHFLRRKFRRYCIQALRENRQPARWHCGEQVMFDVIEHVVCYQRLRPVANCPRKAALRVTVMMDGPDRKESRQALAQKHGDDVILEPANLQNEKDGDYECQIRGKFGPNPPAVTGIRYLQSLSVETQRK